MVVTHFCHIFKLLLQHSNRLNICILFPLAVVTVVKMKNFCWVNTRFFKLLLSKELLLVFLPNNFHNMAELSYYHIVLLDLLEKSILFTHIFVSSNIILTFAPSTHADATSVAMAGVGTYLL